jgi:hypothetical protein
MSPAYEETVKTFASVSKQHPPMRGFDLGAAPILYPEAIEELDHSHASFLSSP